MVAEQKPPLNFPSCPNCGSTRRVANEVLEEEKAKGKAGADVVAFLFQQKSAIKDPNKVVLSSPVIFSFYDACVDCGTVWCIHVEFGTGTPQMPGGRVPAGPGFSRS